MKVGWCFSDRERCGIAIYARNYHSCLKQVSAIECFNTDNWKKNKDSMLSQLNECDIIHIQYETSFFLFRNRDFYTELTSSIKKPIIVTLHEVYRQFPGIFPREQISGNPILSAIKKALYDQRHPLHSAFRRHLSEDFGAQIILVHYQYQKQILIDLDINPQKIFIMPMPIDITIHEYNWDYSPRRPLVFGSTGFINPDFDYKLLFSFLESLSYDWKFIWIGGIRKDEHSQLLNTLLDEITLRHWEDRFSITGWIEEDIQTQLLSGIDIYLALFKNRSSSASLARAIGAIRLIIAVDVELTRNINGMSDLKPLLLVNPDIKHLSEKVSTLTNDTQLRNKQIKDVENYSKRFNFNKLAHSLSNFYTIVSKSSLTKCQLPENITA